MMLNISREQFYNRYDKIKTQKQAMVALIAWDRFVQHMLADENEIISYLKTQTNTKYLLLDHMVQFWKMARNPNDFNRTRHPTTIATYFVYVKAWLKLNEVELDDSKIKDYIRFPKSTQERVRGINREMVQQMYDLANPMYKALIVFLCATGMRIGEALKTEMSWIDFTSDPPKVTIPAAVTKTGQERITFLTPEAVKWIRQIHPEQEGVIFPVSYQSVWSYFNSLRRRCGFIERGTNGFFHTRLHKFRGFCENRLARSVDPEYAHTILGHKKDLIQYHQGGTTDEDAAADYKLAIPELTISER